MRQQSSEKVLQGTVRPTGQNPSSYGDQGGRIWHKNDLVEEKYICVCCQLNSRRWMWIKVKVVD